jgi:hypothetical protein
VIAGRRRRCLVALVSAVAVIGTAATTTAAADLSGVWQRIGNAPLQPTGTRDLARCIPQGAPELMFRAEPFQLLQTAELVLFLHEANHLPRFVFMNSTHPTGPDPTHLGHSVGRWEGDTLVIDTVGFHDKSGVGKSAVAHTAALHVVERLTLRQGGRVLQDELLMEDSGAITRSSKRVISFRRRAGARLKENLCAWQH